MENTYLGILRGKMLPMEISAHMLLKDAEDKIFYLETKQMSGFTTKQTLKNALNSALEQDPRAIQLNILLDELSTMNIDQEHELSTADISNGQPLLEWIEIKK